MKFKTSSLTLGLMSAAILIVLMNLFVTPAQEQAPSPGQVHHDSSHTNEACITEAAVTIERRADTTQAQQGFPETNTFRRMEEIIRSGLSSEEIAWLESRNGDVRPAQLAYSSDQAIAQLIDKIATTEASSTRNYLIKVISQLKDEDKEEAVDALLLTGRDIDIQAAISISAAISSQPLQEAKVSLLLLQTLSAELSYSLLEVIAEQDALKESEEIISALHQLYYQAKTLELKAMALIAMTPSLVSPKTFEDITFLAGSGVMQGAEESVVLLKEWLKQVRKNLTIPQIEQLKEHMEQLAGSELEAIDTRIQALEAIRLLDSN